ncbi:MAG: CotH kinase family protein [Candidatus Krumholzibacteriota bacterium]
MRIKSSSNPATDGARVRGFLRHLLTRRFLLVAILVALITGWSLVMVYYGMRLYKFKQAESINDLVFDVAAEKVAFVPNYLKSLRAQPEKLYFDIKFEDLQKVAYFRELSLDRGKILPDVKQETIKAKIRHRGETYSADLHLTGLNLDHVLRADKVSYRTKIKKGKTLLGMREFTLLVPKSRGYLSEWVGHELERRENLVTLRYDFVDVTINGKHVGLYCLEEHYDKRLVESNRFREGLLFKPGLQEVDVYNRKKILADPVKNKQHVLLSNMWQAFLVGELAPGDLFALDKIAIDFAIADLLQGHHSKFIDNIRYYLNPVTNLIEPATREWNPLRRSDVWRGDTTAKLFIETYEHYNKVYYERFFSDAEFVRHYVQALDRVSRVEYLDNFFAEIKPQMDVTLGKIYQDNPFYSYPRERLYRNQEVIRLKLRKYDEAVAAHLEAGGEQLRIAVSNPLRWPIILERVTSQDTLVFRAENSAVLPARMTNAFREFSFLPDAEALTAGHDNELTLHFRVVGLDSVLHARVLPVPHKGSTSFAYNPLTAESDLADFDWIELREGPRTIVLRSGTRVLDRDLVLPAGYTVVAERGLVLDLHNRAKIISYSPLEFRGAADEPIAIVSSDSTGQGILVFNADRRSHLSHVRFDNLANPADRGWTVTGAVTFYQSDVDLADCTFTHNRTGDDFLNIIRADFEMAACRFEGIFADALDADFCTGRLRDSFFTNCGNDAIDISGTQLDVTGLYVDRVGDKGLSSGENSRMTVRDARILRAEIAVCSKDRSELLIGDSNIGESRVAFAAFQKKAEFGGSRIQGSRITIDGHELLCLVETGSQLILDGRTVPSDRDNVKELLYGAEYGKASK